MRSNITKRPRGKRNSNSFSTCVMVQRQGPVRQPQANLDTPITTFLLQRKHLGDSFRFGTSKQKLGLKMLFQEQPRPTSQANCNHKQKTYEKKKNSFKRLVILAPAAFWNENVHVKQKHTGRLCVRKNTLSDSAATCLLEEEKKNLTCTVEIWQSYLRKSREVRQELKPCNTSTLRRARGEAREEPAAVLKEGTSFRAPCVSLMWNSKCWQGGKPPRLPQDLIQIIKSPVQNMPVCL